MRGVGDGEWRSVGFEEPAVLEWPGVDGVEPEPVDQAHRADCHVVFAGVIQAIRSWIDTDSGAQTGWLGALQDRSDRARHHPYPPRPGPGVDASVAGGRDRDVTLGVRSKVHRPRRQARNHLPRALAHAPRARRAERARRHGRRARGPAPLPLRSRLRARAFKRVSASLREPSSAHQTRRDSHRSARHRPPTPAAAVATSVSGTIQPCPPSRRSTSPL